MFDLRPAVIAQCCGVVDIIRALSFAREHDLPLAVRGGGHAVDGKGSCDGGLLLDLAPMTGVHVSVADARATVQAGARWAIVDRETQLHGLATTGGTVSDTGVAGLTLGGGVGWAMRSLGATVDNVRAIDAVTVEGKTVRASATENPDLFWGMRGGGGNFAIATAFEFQLHQFGPMVLAGLLLHPAERMREALRFAADYLDAAPREVMGICGLLRIPPVDPYPAALHGRLMAQIGVAYTGDLSQAEEALRPLRVFGPPEAELVGPMPYVVLQRIIETSLPLAMTPPGVRSYEKGGYLSKVSDEVIETLALAAESAPETSGQPGHLAMASIWRMGGALDDVDEDAMAFSRAGAAYFWNIVTQWPNAGDDDEYMGWTRGVAQRLAPFSLGRFYVNLAAEDAGDRTSDAYGGAKYDRLVELKNRWDPENVLRFNKNIAPTAAARS